MSALKSRSHPEAPAKLALSFIFPLIDCLCVSTTAPFALCLGSLDSRHASSLHPPASQPSSALDGLVFTLSPRLEGSAVTISLPFLDSNTLSFGERFLCFFAVEEEEGEELDGAEAEITPGSRWSIKASKWIQNSSRSVSVAG